ncbi:MAG: hypothetical protein JST19_15530 [Bacteroidetes bacterium]|nr:hypothetical protein [Bacteroidota bacterium]
MNTGSRLLLSISLLIMGACNQQPQKSQPIQPVKRPDFVQPFRFHKMIEVSPGQDYDVLSWGRGSAMTGSFLILHSDSAAKKFTTTTGDLNGTIVDVYNSDMDLDGNPEILIQARGTDSTNYATVYAFEFNNNKADKLDFPKLTRSQRKGYRGGDNFYIKEGKFIREFPIYESNDKDAKPTAAKRVLEYGLHGNEFTVKQLSKDSTDSKTVSVTQSQPAKASSSNKSKSSKKSQQHSLEKKHKKKKRHHSSN